MVPCQHYNVSVFWGPAPRCVDIDECAELSPPPCNATTTCTNTIGSYYCSVRSAFRWVPLGLPIGRPTCVQPLIHADSLRLAPGAEGEGRVLPQPGPRTLEIFDSTALTRVRFDCELQPIMATRLYLHRRINGTGRSIDYDCRSFTVTPVGNRVSVRRDGRSARADFVLPCS